jgi:hypothetical protein
MVPEPTQMRRPSHTDATHDDTAPFVSEECLVLRNYHNDTHVLTVRFRDADDETVFHRRYPLTGGVAVSVAARLERGVYRITARLDDGPTATSDCLVGSGPDETALVEIGNGIMSVAEGVL